MPSKTQLKKLKYFDQVEIWKRKYGYNNGSQEHDLTQIRLTFQDRICAKKGCDRTYNLHRHHKGHDYIFACILPDVYAERYIQYHNDDCIYLCKQHHEAVHRYYAPVVDEFFREANGLQGKVLLNCCEKYKTRLIKMCDNFTNTKVKSNAKPRRKGVVKGK